MTNPPVTSGDTFLILPMSVEGIRNVKSAQTTFVVYPLTAGRVPRVGDRVVFSEVTGALFTKPEFVLGGAWVSVTLTKVYPVGGSGMLFHLEWGQGER